MALKVMYTIFLGLLVALFVGLGIAAFYPAPKAPDYPIELREPKIAPTSSQPAPETEAERQQRIDFDKKSDHFYKDIQPKYNRNVSIIAMIGAILVLVISLTLVSHIQLLSDGLLLGGVLTLLYSIIRGLMGENNIHRFLVVTVGLVIALVLGYIKFLKPHQSIK